MLWWNLWFFVTSYVPSSSLLKLPISSSGAWPFFVKRNDEDVRQWGCDSKKKQAQHTKKQEWDVTNELEQDMWSDVSHLSYCCLHLPAGRRIYLIYVLGIFEFSNWCTTDTTKCWGLVANAIFCYCSSLCYACRDSRDYGSDNWEEDTPQVQVRDWSLRGKQQGRDSQTLLELTLFPDPDPHAISIPTSYNNALKQLLVGIHRKWRARDLVLG